MTRHKTIRYGRDASRQFQLELAADRPDYARRSFILAPSTAAALATADAFAGSLEPALAISGPSGSGKTHLLHIMAAARGVRVRDGRRIGSSDCASEPLCLVDDADGAPAPKALLVLIETCRRAGGKLVLAGAGAPGGWAKGLRDLETRLESMPRIALEEPDEELLRAVIAQLFRRRQWRATPGVPAYAAPRIARTFAAARGFVDAAGGAAIASGRPINLALARKVLDNLSEAASPS